MLLQLLAAILIVAAAQADPEVDSLINLFISTFESTGAWNREHFGDAFNLQSYDPAIANAMLVLEKTQDCSVVHDYLKEKDGSSFSEQGPKLHLVTVPRGNSEYYDPDTMSLQEIAVALGFVDNHEQHLMQHMRRVEIIAHFREEDYVKLAQRLGCNDGNECQCFARHMIRMREFRNQKNYPLKSFVSPQSFRELRHNDFRRHCSRCAEQAQCFFGGFGEGSEFIHKIQRFMNWLDVPQAANYQWMAPNQLVQLLKFRLKERDNDMELALKWNLCLPNVESITVLVPSLPHAPFSYIREIKHPKLKIKQIFPSVSFFDALEQLKGIKSGYGVVARSDVILGEGFAALATSTALALTHHEAIPSLGLGTPLLDFCRDEIGGEHSAFVIPLPLRDGIYEGSHIWTGLQYGETGFVQSICDSGIQVENPCATHKVYQFSRVTQLRPFKHSGMEGKVYMGEAKSCKSGDSGDSCCARKRRVESSDNSWEAVLQSPVWASMTGEDTKFDPYALGFAEPDMMAFTHAVQTFLYNWQHPADCSKARFQSVGGDYSGIGSILHMMTVAMSRAIDDGRIFTYHNGFLFAEKGDYCTTPTMECFVLPLSGCSKQDIDRDLVGNPGDRKSDWTYITDPYIHIGPPKVLERWLLKYDIPTPSYYWWRAQGLMYLLRFNQRTKNEMLQIRKSAWEKGVVIPPNTVSMHVRHGDKASEMRLVDFIDFIRAAKLYTDFEKVFVSTEDPKVIEEAKQVNEFPVMWVEEERHNHGLGEKVNRGSREFIQSMLNLMTALECDSWVGTRGSNWNRMIDELRATRIGKARDVYFEVGDHTFGP